MANRFIVCTASYFAPFSDLEAVTATALEQHTNLSETSSGPDSKYSCTLSRMTKEQVAEITYPGVVARSPTPVTRTTLLDVYAPNMQRGLFDTRGTWPNVRVLVLWTDMGLTYCPWGARVLSDMLKEPAGEGEQRRDVNIVQLKDANHFVSTSILSISLSKLFLTIHIYRRSTGRILTECCECLQSIWAVRGRRR